MDYMSFFLSVLISQVSIHFYLGDFHNLGLRRYSFSLSRNFKTIENPIIKLETPNRVDLIKDKVAHLSEDKVVLTRNLKHLEFIGFLENHLYNETSEKIPLEFLSEFNSIKQDVQLKTIEVTQKLS